jgi:two-component system cell cycle sensor histidine kinase/response regulator CckA
MEDDKLKLLVVEDDEDDYLLVRDLLKTGVNAEVERAATADQALERSGARCYDAMLLDYRLGARTGLEVLRDMRRRDIAAPVIFLTGQGDEQVAVEAMKAGATDYLSKSKLNPQDLSRAVHYAISLRHKEAAVEAVQRALQASEQRFRTLVENSSDLITLLAADGTLLYVSQSAQRILGYAPEELIETNALALVHPDDLPEVRTLFAEALASPAVPLRNEHRTRHKDGHYVLFEATGVNRLHDDAVRAIVLNSRDISERRQAEADYRTLFENANDAIMIFDPETEEILEVNPKACEMYGFERSELPGKSLKELTRDVERGRSAVQDCLQKGSLKDYQTVHFRRDGVPIHVLASASAITYRGRKAILTISRDVTAHRAAEQEIRRLNRALQALSKSNQAVLKARDKRELLQEICHIVVEVGGHRMAWVAQFTEDQANLHPVAAAGDHDGYLLAVSRKPPAVLQRLPPVVAWRTGAPQICRDISAEPRYAALHGEWAKRGYACMISLPLDVNSHRFGVLSIYSGERNAFDVAEVELLRELAANVAYGVNALHTRAERERAEQQLRASEQRYRLLFERNLAGVFRATCDGRMLDCNDALVRMLGYGSREELLQADPKQLFADAAERDLAFAEIADKGQLVNRELQVRRKDGSSCWQLFNITLLLDEQGKASQLEATVLDVTERRSLQEQLLHSQKLEAVGQLAGGVAHDFNNLLMVIGSHAELLRDSTDSPVPRRKAQEILGAVERGSSLTGQLLAFSRKQVLSPRVLDLNGTLAELCATLPRMLGEKIKVCLRCSADLWPVKADPAQIEQVIVNLAVNARDAMPNGGRLTLETANVELDDAYVRTHAGVQAGSYAMVAVSDTGEGIPRDVQPHIFEPFFTTKEHGKGTGLGLPTVYGIVQQSGGFIWVYSEPGHGTVFKIYLPKTEEAAAQQRQLPQAAAPQRGTETLLLVEDEEAVRDAVREYLSLKGYQVLSAPDGEKALALAAGFSDPIHVVITDVVMPGMNGSDVAARLLAARPETRVLFVSGYTETTLGQHGIGNNAAFLQKPFSLSSLAAKIRELLPAAVQGQQEATFR